MFCSKRVSGSPGIFQHDLFPDSPFLISLRTGNRQQKNTPSYSQPHLFFLKDLLLFLRSIHDFLLIVNLFVSSPVKSVPSLIVFGFHIWSHFLVEPISFAFVCVSRVEVLILKINHWVQSLDSQQELRRKSQKGSINQSI